MKIQDVYESMRLFAQMFNIHCFTNGMTEARGSTGPSAFTVFSVPHLLLLHVELAHRSSVEGDVGMPPEQN